jgi:putative Mn2+ efflux pump MntP
MTDEQTDALLMLLVAVFALGMAVTLAYLRDFVAGRFRFPIYVGVGALLMATSGYVIKKGPGAGMIAGLFVAFLGFVVLAQSLEEWRKETEEHKRNVRPPDQ